MYQHEGPDPALSDHVRVLCPVDPKPRMRLNQVSDEGKGSYRVMRKIQILGLALFAVFALAAVSASSAFAEAELLLNGAKMTAAQEIPTEDTGELLLEDMGATGKPDVLCSGTFDGHTEGPLLGLVTAVLNLAKEGSGTLVECVDDNNVCSSPVDVTALNLPWHFEILLMVGGTFWYYLFMLLFETGKVPAYEVDCNSLLGLVADTCETPNQEDGSSGPMENATGGLLTEFSESENANEGTVPGNCSVGGAKMGLLAGDGFLTSTSGTLTVSE